MLEKVKIASPYLLIVFLVLLLIAFNSFPFRVVADDATTQVTVGNSAPVVSSVSLNGGDAIVLTENTTTAVVITGLITDSNSCEDVMDGSYKAYFFFSGAAGGASCSADTDECYQVASCSSDARNTCDGTSDTSFLVTCTTNFQYYATPTDGTASDSAENWWGALIATDATGDDHGASNSTQTIDVGLLRALNASASINYDAVGAGNDTGASPIEAGVENTGNSGMNPTISSTTTLICTSGGCSVAVDTIADANQKYASVSQDYDDEYNVTLTGSAVELELNTPKPNSDTAPVDAQIFWGLGVDPGQAAGTYQGTTTFTVTGD